MVERAYVEPTALDVVEGGGPLWPVLLATALSGLTVTAGVVVLGLPAIKGAQPVDDLLGTRVTRALTNKAAEVRLIEAGALLIVVVAAALSVAAWRLQRGMRSWRTAVEAPTRSALAVGLGILAVTVATIWLHAGGDRGASRVVAVSGALAVAAMAFSPRDDAYRAKCLFLGLVIPADIVAVLSGASAVWPGDAVTLPFVPFHHLFAIGAVVTAVTALIFRDRTSTSYPARLDGAVRWFQVPAPLVVLAAFRPTFATDTGLVRAEYTPGMVIAIAIAVGAMAWNVRSAARADARHHVVTLPSVWAIALIVSMPSAAPSAFAMADDFHIGEQLIQFPQLHSFDRAAFDSFHPVPGLIGAFTGAINSLLFGGTAAGWPLAAGAVRAAAVVFGATALSYAVGRWWALGLLALPLFPFDRLYFVIPFVVVLGIRALVRRPELWLPVWAVGAVVNTLLVTANGLAVAVATLPVAAWQFGRLLTNWQTRGVPRRNIVISLATTLACPLVVLPVLLRVARFMLTTGGANDVLYGIPLVLGNAVPGTLLWLPRAAEVATWEVLRSSAWIVSLPLVVALAVNALVLGGRRWSAQAAPLVVLCVGTAGFLLLSVPYAYGRVDDQFSRLGSLSLMTMAMLAPVALLSSGARWRGAAALAAVGVAAGTWIVIAPGAPHGVVARLLRPVPAGGDLVPASATATPDVLGSTLIPSRTASFHARVKGAVDAVVEPGETFYDMVNRGALYFVVRKPVPTPYPSVFYAATTSDQRAVVRAFERDAPPLVWIEPAIPYDETPASQRAYRVYRWLLSRGYVLRGSDELRFLVRPDRADRLPTLPGDEMELMAATFKPSLADAAVTWGASFDRIRRRLEGLTHLATATAADGVTVRVENGVPKNADVLVLRAECPRRQPVGGLGSVSWVDPVTATTRTVDFNAGGRTLVVLLGAHPAWVRHGVPAELHVRFANGRCTAVTVTEAAAARLAA